MLIIDIWADFVCPFSYIGIKNLTQAIKNEKLENVEFHYHSFLQYPFAKQGDFEPMQQYLTNKYGVSELEAWTYMEDVAKLAAESDLHFKLDKLSPTNTFTAHRLAKLAKRHNRHTQFYEVLQRAFFEQQQALDQPEVLKQLSEMAGVPLVEVEKVLANSALFEAEVEADLYRAQQLRIQGTPYFIVNGDKHITGAKSVESFVQVLKNSQ